MAEARGGYPSKSAKIRVLGRLNRPKRARHIRTRKGGSFFRSSYQASNGEGVETTCRLGTAVKLRAAASPVAYSHRFPRSLNLLCPQLYRVGESLLPVKLPG